MNSMGLSVAPDETIQIYLHPIVTGLGGLCAAALARRDKGRIGGNRAVTLGLLIILSTLALVQIVLPDDHSGSGEYGLAAAIIGVPLMALIVIESAMARRLTLYLPDALFVTSLAALIGFVPLIVFLVLLPMCLLVQRLWLAYRRRRPWRAIRHQPLFAPALIAWIPCAILSALPCLFAVS